MELYDYEVNNPLNNEKEGNCYYCGNPCNKTYCSDGCKKADLED